MATSRQDRGCLCARIGPSVEVPPISTCVKTAPIRPARIRRPSGSLEQLGWPLGFTTERPDALLVRNVRVIPGTGAEPEEPVDLLIRNGRIGRIAAAGSLGDGGGATVLDAEGRTAIPGMIDLHSHLLPAIDDGSRSPEQSLASLSLFREAGVTDVVFTPHVSAWEKIMKII